MKENMFYGASNLIFQKAEELRNRMTPAEEVLWKHIHINEWKIKFRRQHPIASYVADFYCHSIKLVIELDGGIHEEEEVKRLDESRENHLKELGLTVLRFKNEEVFQNKSSVLDKIAETIGSLRSSPLGDGGTIRVLQSPPLGDGGLDVGMSSLYIIKIGGNIIDDSAKLSSFLESFASVKGKKILIHGGGKLATKLAEDMKIPQQMVDGRRITDAETLKIVTMVYAGYINKNIVAQLQANNCSSIGISGADGNAILAHKRVNAKLDYGFVGDIDAIDIAFLKNLLEQDLSIVVAPITHDKKGQLLNTNADTISQEIAKAMSKEYNVQLLYSFEKSGVLLDANDDNTVITSLNPAYYAQLKSEQKIFAGMIPKLDNAFTALNSGVKKVIIGKAEELNDLINGTKGTTLTND